MKASFLITVIRPQNIRSYAGFKKPRSTGHSCADRSSDYSRGISIGDSNQNCLLLQ